MNNVMKKDYIKVMGVDFAVIAREEDIALMKNSEWLKQNFKQVREFLLSSVVPAYEEAIELIRIYGTESKPKEPTVKEIVQEAIKEALDRNRRLDELYERLDLMKKNNYNDLEKDMLNNLIQCVAGKITDKQREIADCNAEICYYSTFCENGKRYYPQYLVDLAKARLAYLEGDINEVFYNDKVLLLEKKLKDKQAEERRRNEAHTEAMKLAERMGNVKKPEKKSWFSWA